MKIKVCEKDTWRNIDEELDYECLLRDTSDIHRFQTVHMVKTHFLLENLWISESFLGMLKKVHTDQLSLI